jgi:regulation of enolase protein 1 (concanavalin A-like superfamily)
VTAYTSADGARWAVIGSDTIALGATAYVGVAVTSHNTGMRTTASLSDLAVTGAGLPSAQASADIGAPAIAGSASFAAGAYTIRAGGRDIWDASDEFHYIYQPVTGNVEVIARVASLTAAHRWSKAGVMIRESLAPGSRHAMALTSAASGYAFQRRSETGAWSDHTDGGAGTAPGWVRLVRTAARVEAYRSVDGSHWVSMGSAAVNMADTVYVGIAVTSHDVAVAATAVIDSLRITESAAAVNKPPSVILNGPTNGENFTAPATFTVSAAATDSDGTIAAVDFYANSSLITRDTSAPYSASVSSMAAGTYVWKAVASDDLGASTISESVTITVTGIDTGTDAGTGTDSGTDTGTGTPPLGIAFTASADHATLVTKYVLEVYKSGATPGATSPVGISNLGKPAPTSTGEITVERSTFFAALAPGSYIATVVAVGDGGSGRSGTVSFTR